MYGYLKQIASTESLPASDNCLLIVDSINCDKDAKCMYYQLLIEQSIKESYKILGLV